MFVGKAVAGRDGKDGEKIGIVPAQSGVWMVDELKKYHFHLEIGSF